MNYTCAFAALLLALAASNSSADQTNTSFMNSETFCPDLKPQSSLDFEQIMDKWYVVEVIKHKIDPINPTSGRVVVETCPTVQIRFTGRASLGLLWTEKAGNLDYSFNVPDLFRSPGFWSCKEPQNGTLLNRKYVQFIGSVQVMKAVASHMVLTFCSKTPDNQLYSILLSREHHLPESDSTGVRNLLFRRGLTIASVQDTCVNAGSRKESSNVTRWMTVFVTAVTATLLAATCTTTTTTTSFGI